MLINIKFWCNRKLNAISIHQCLRSFSSNDDEIGRRVDLKDFYVNGVLKAKRKLLFELANKLSLTSACFSPDIDKIIWVPPILITLKE